MPVPYYPSSPAQQVQHIQQTDYFVRRGSLPAPSDMQRRSVESPEVTGWQTVPVSEMAPAKAIKTSPRPSNPVIAA